MAENISDIQDKDRFDVVLANPPFGGKERPEVQQNFPIKTGETAFLFLQHFIKSLRAGGRAAIVIKNTFLSGGDNASVVLRKELLENCNLHTVLDMPGGTFQGAGVKTVALFFEKGAPTKDIWFYEHQVPDGQKAYSMTKPIRLEHFQGCIDWWGGKTRRVREETPHAWKVAAEEVKARGYNLDIKNPHAVADDHGDPDELLENLNVADAQTASLRNQLKAILTDALAR